MALKTVGKSFGHIEGSEKVSGRAVYTADLRLPQMLWGKTLRSPFAHAKVLRLDTSRAKQMPGILAVLTASDLPDILTGRRLYDMPLLARDRVRFAGERVAVVIAEEPSLAQHAISQIEVEYEELPAVFDPLAAVQEGAPVLHADLQSYKGLPQPSSTIRNACSHGHWTLGDITEGFREADEIFEHTFTTQHVHQGYLEPHAGVVALGEDDRVHVWMSNKVPYSLKGLFSHAVDLPPEKIVVHLTSIGGDFGAKGSLMDVPLCYHAAKLTGRPVKMVMNYTEELMAANPRHPSVIRVKTGVKRNGRIVARQFEIFWNSGAYGAMKPTPNVNLAAAPRAAGPYRIPNIEVDSYVVYTNCVPCGHFRAPGHPQVVFAGESQIDMIAEKLGMDRVELRLLNALRDGDPIPDSPPMENVKCRETLEAVVKASGWRKSRRRPNVGRGLAISHRNVGIGHANARVTVHPDGTVSLLSTHTDTGTGSSTIMCQIVAEVLGISFDRVRVEFGSTDTYESETGTGASRVTHVMGQATFKAATEVSELLKRKAAEELHCPSEEIVLKGGRCARRGRGRRALSFSQLATAAAERGEPIEAQSYYSATQVPPDWSFSAVVAETEVDPETGQVLLRNLTSAHDVGTIINPVAHQAQIDGGIIQGVGYALTEEIQMQEGHVTTLNLGDYKLPNVKDVPPLKTVLVKEPVGPAPFQAKEIGESPIAPVAAAIANAVCDAVGVRVMDLPITAEKVFSALNRPKRGT